MEVDKYGSIGDGFRYEIDPKKVQSRTEKWRKMLGDWQNWITRKSVKVKKRVRKGIPDRVRGEAWCLLARTEPIKNKYPRDYYQELLSSESPSADDIELDLNRTFPEHEMFQEGGFLQEPLRRVLSAYSLHDPDLGYCQGMPIIVAIFLINMDEEDAFWLFVSLLQNYHVREMYLPGMNEVYKHMYVSNALFKKHLSGVWKYMKRNDVEPSLFVPNWFLTLFINVLPIETSLRVLDVLFSEGVKVLYRVYLAVFRIKKAEIKSTEQHDLLMCIRSIPQTLTTGQLFANAFSFSISRQKIQHLATAYFEDPDPEFIVR